MRRMLDPKELEGLGGGGSTAPERHAYRILVDTFCWFLSFTEKDYGYDIGKKKDIPVDFYTNPIYQDLIYKGYHPAGGYYNGDQSDLIVSYVRLSDNTIAGYRVSTKTTISSVFDLTKRKVNIIQLN